MGRSKALLDLGGRSAIERVVATARTAKLAGSVLVVRREEEAAARLLSNAEVVVNPRPAAGRTGTLQRGLERVIHKAAAVLVHPVDHPLVLPETLIALCNAWAQADPRPALTEPLLGSRKGHPILLDQSLFAAILALARDAPLYQLMRETRDAGRACGLAVDDRGILANLDTPADLRRWGF